MLALAGAPLPQDRAVDGLDLSPVLFAKEGATGHECVFLYKTGSSLNAVRCGDHKLYFSKDEPARLFNVKTDLGEAAELDLSDTTHKAIADNIVSARATHLATVIEVPDQVALGGDRAFALCADPRSTEKYPTLPNCTISPENWVAPWEPPSPPSPPAPFIHHVGCFWDKGWPTNKGGAPCDLPVVKRGHCPKIAAAAPQFRGPWRSQPMTVEQCNGLCDGYRFFALQNGGTGCFCGTSYGRYGASPNCTMPCAGNSSQSCGGPGVNDIYEVTNSTQVV